MRDPYQVLGVARTADAGAIKSAYRKLVVADDSPRPTYRDDSQRVRRPAADFPAALFPWK